MWVPRAAAPTVRVRLEPLADLAAGLADGAIYRITRAAVYRHLQANGTVAEIATFLRGSSGQSLPPPACARLETWGREFGRLRLRTVTVLEADTRETLRDLFAMRGTRRYLAETLSPRVAVVAPGWERSLADHLYARGYLPRVELPIVAADPPSDLTANETAYLWLAVQVYRGLARSWDLPLRVPQTIVERLESRRPAHLDPGTARPWVAAAEACDAALRHLDPPTASASLAVGDEEEAALSHEESPQRAVLVAQLEAAIAAGATVTMTYYTAGRDAVTERRVEPLRVEWWGEVPYLIAWCTWRRAERVFRIDRIRRLVQLGVNM